MIEVWLVIHLLIVGQDPIVVEDSRQPDLATCWSAARAALDRADKIDGGDTGFELAAQCSVVKQPNGPA